MHSYWKLATAGTALIGVTALTTGVTTAYLMRPAPEASPPTSPAVAPTPAHGVQKTSTRVVSTAPTYRTATVAAPRALSVPPSPVTPVANRVTPAATVSPDCATGADRAWRIAKPGLLGTLLGAGLGAAGGAIADGGGGAGKGAVIGGLAGAAVGSAYGAYKTKTECGTIFGGHGFTDTPQAVVPGADSSQAALRTSDQITVYSAR